MMIIIYRHNSTPAPEWMNWCLGGMLVVMFAVDLWSMFQPPKSKP